MTKESAHLATSPSNLIKEGASSGDVFSSFKKVVISATTLMWYQRTKLVSLITVPSMVKMEDAQLVGMAMS